VEENESALERVARPTFIFLMLPILALISGLVIFGWRMINLGPIDPPPPSWLSIAVFVLQCALFLGFLVASGLGARWLLRRDQTRARNVDSGETHISITALRVPAACPFCKADLARADLGSGVIRCGDCEVAHHSECWQSHGGCTTLGCSRGPCERSERTDVSVGPSR
jgi:hypothetical protein